MNYWLLLAILSPIAFGGSGFLYKIGAEKRFSTIPMLSGLYLSGGLLFVITAFYQQIHWQFNLAYLIAGIVIAAGSSLGNVFVNRALRNGPASLTSPLVNLNVILVACMAIIFFGERLTINELLGVILVIISASLIKFDPHDQLKITNKIWYLFIVLAIGFIFCREGGLKITQEFGFNNTLVLLYAYLISFMAFFLLGLIKNKRNNVGFNNPKPWLLGISMGIFSYLGLFLYVSALKLGPASIIAPLFSLRSLVIILLSVIIYRERLSKFQWLATMLAIIATLIISL